MSVCIAPCQALDKCATCVSGLSVCSWWFLAVRICVRSIYKELVFGRIKRGCTLAGIGSSDHKYPCAFRPMASVIMYRNYRRADFRGSGPPTDILA